jgi:ATP-binding cassette, subfamily B, bacterial PglK
VAQSSELLALILRQNRKLLMGLLILTFISSLFEVISLGLLVPFLAVLSNPESLEKYKIFNFFGLDFLNRDPSESLLILTILFVTSVFFAATVRLLLIWVSAKFATGVGSSLSYEMYAKALNQPYEFHLGKNSSELITLILNKTNSIVYGSVMPAVTLFISTITGLSIFFLLALVSPKITMVSLFIFVGLYYLIGRATKRQIKVNSICIATESENVLKGLQESFGGIRDVIIDCGQQYWLELYRKQDALLRKANISTVFISQSPRYFMEGMGMMAIAIFAYFQTSIYGSGESVIPILGVFALGAQRMLPILQQIFSSVVSIRTHSASLQDVLAALANWNNKADLKSPKLETPLEGNIIFNNISYKYPDAENYVLQNISLVIKKGGRYGIIGKSGVGKSTLLDILMGLISPTSGLIEVNGKAFSSLVDDSWRKQVAHVPQSIYLVDGTIEENIALGVKKSSIDESWVKCCASRASLANDIESWEYDYQTVVGERGVRLSGGQKQRIGIARALYKGSKILILDEATSSLDAPTENEIMSLIKNLSSELTIIIVAHRMNTLSVCNEIIELKSGRVERVCGYKDILSTESTLL